MKTNLAALPADGVFRATAAEARLRNLLVVGGVGGALALVIALGGKGRLHAPNLALLALQPLTLRLHIAAACLAFALGCVLLARPKGGGLHRALGWAWVVAMLTVAISSFLFPWVFKGHLSPIHLLSGWVAIGAPMGVAYARRHDIGGHRRMMTYNFLLGLVVAGAFTLVPGRLMWRVFFG
jgi:uncharacterized membrane protein